MSQRIVLSLFVSTLLGACALDSSLVSAQQVATSVVKPTANGTSATTVPATATVQTGSEIDDPTQDEMEPDAPVKLEQGTPSETAALPPPLPPCPSEAGSLPSRVAIQICQQVRTEPPPTELKVQNRPLRKLDILVPFYSQRNYQMAWLDTSGRPLPAAIELIKALGEAERDGLRSTDYGRGSLQKLETHLQQERGADARALAEADLLFTDAYLQYASHLLSGRLSPRKVDPDWAIKPRSRDLAKVLTEALASGSIAESLQNLAPKEKGYTQLREVLQRYRQVEQAGGWPVVSGTLGMGAQGASVRNLRARLRASGDLADSEVGKTIYDKALAEAVRQFQKRHGLKETGTVNGATQAALNVPVSQRIRQVELNMERWRWLPDELGNRYILVNIPSFKMNVIENGKPVMEAKVVVGREERQTPAFTANMAYLVMSPKWYVPRSIAVKDKLPQLRRNPYALAKQNIRIYNKAGQQINPASVNWKAVGANNFNYQFRQDAGPRNALGGIKFMFPNPYNVYLHDTPTRALFSRDQRTFSSGCIRLSNPVELAEYLLKHDPKWNRQTIKAAASSGKQRVVNLPQEVPVYLLYWTVWVDEQGLTNFRGDIYNRDKPMVRALYQESGAVVGKKDA